MERALFVILALGINAVVMGPWVAEPFMALSQVPMQLIRTIERKLNRPQRTLSVRRQRGLLLLVTVLLVALAMGLIVNRLHFRLLTIAVLMVLLPVRPAWNRTDAIARSLKTGDIASARLDLKGTVWRHYALLDEHALARAGIELLAVQFSEKIMAPALWFMLLGMPGFLIEKALYLLKETLCQPISSNNGFAEPIVMLHRIMNYLPSRMAALLWLPTMIFLPLGQSLAAIKHLVKGVISNLSPEQLSVLAGACVLGLSLGGPTSVYTAGQWFGYGTAKASASDTARGLYLFGLLQLFLILGLGLCL